MVFVAVTLGALGCLCMMLAIINNNNQQCAARSARCEEMQDHSSLLNTRAAAGRGLFSRGLEAG